MENRVIVDWFSFSVRYDAKSPVAFRGTLDVDFICELLGIPFEEFASIGRVKYYQECYKCGGISISVPFAGKEGRQGYFVTMTGEGCRYFERNTYHTLYESTFDIWQAFFKRLRHLVTMGLAVNIPRFDNAVDDFSGLLDLDRIMGCVERGEACSRFRRRRTLVGMDNLYSEPSRLVCSYQHNIVGRSVEFGSRESRSFCRFYDKKAEQMQRHFADAEEMGRLRGIDKWTRMEFEFKDETAIAMVNAFCDEADYVKFFTNYVNGMLRFINRDNGNVTRCSVAGWWAAFLGTTERTSLSLGDFKPLSRERHLRYVYSRLSGVIYAAMNIEGVDRFLNGICAVAAGKLKPRHAALCEGRESRLQSLCSADLWRFLCPNGQRRLAYAP